LKNGWEKQALEMGFQASKQVQMRWTNPDNKNHVL